MASGLPSLRNSDAIMVEQSPFTSSYRRRNNMSANFDVDPSFAAQVLNLIREERAKALSPREWNHRLAGYGYAIKDTSFGKVVATLPQGVEICAVPSELVS
jgi:hypothetical protein